MAIEPPITPTAAWNALLTEQDEIIHNLERSQDRHQRQELDRRLAAVEEQLLDLPAPDLEGVMAKLHLLWSEELHGEDSESNRKLGVLIDLAQLSGA